MFVFKSKYLDLEAKYQEKCEELKNASNTNWQEGYKAGQSSVTVKGEELEELRKLRLLSSKLERFDEVKAQLAVEKAKVDAMLKLANALNQKGGKDE